VHHFRYDHRCQQADRGVTRRGLILFAIMSVIWGIPYLFIRVAVEEISPATLVFARTSIAVLFLLPIALLTTDLRPVTVDLRNDWPAALADAGFDATKPTAWIAEGLLGYLPPDAQDRLLDQIGELSPAGSRLAAEGVPSHHEVDQEELREKMKDSTDRWRDHGFDLDFSELVFLGDRSELTGYLKGRGWTVDAAPTNELLIRYGLEPLDDGEGFADVVYVTATK
jgi:methyltransferase (TIGR00027 family)